MHRCGTVIGYGNSLVQSCLELLHIAVYQRWISVEFEGIEDCFSAMAKGAENLKILLQNVGCHPITDTLKST